MLGKLLRYEFRSCMKKLGGLWIGAFVLLAANTVLLNVYDFEQGDELVGAMMMVMPALALTFTCVAVILMPIIYIVTRFYKSMTGSEGYLMFTLPVKSGQLITSKLIVALVAEVISVVVVSVPSAVIGIFQKEMFPEIFSGVAEMFEMMEVSGPLTVTLYLISIVLSAVEGILRIYFSIALGHLAKKHRVAASIGAYIGLNYAYNILNACYQMAYGCNYFVMENTSTAGYYYGSSVFTIVVAVILIVAEFILTRYIFDKRLNLE